MVLTKSSIGVLFTVHSQSCFTRLRVVCSALLSCCLQFFVIGHDCGHRSFSTNKLLEDIVGTLAFMPLVYPFEPWRIKHNQHHAQTNK
jgi:fatty acid desaturase